MYVARLALHDFRSYPEVEISLGRGPTAFIGANGQGKTNLVEAVDYLSRLDSHRVSSDTPLVRATADGPAERAVVRADVVRGERTALLELEITPGRSNRARVNRAPLPRVRDLVGILRSVTFSPEDLALVKGDPSDRRRFLDGLVVLRAPRLAGVKADYERVVRQRNTLLKSARNNRQVDLSTLEIWDDKLVGLGGELVSARIALLQDLAPHLGEAYLTVAAHADAGRRDVRAEYRSSTDIGGAVAPHDVTEALRAGLADRRKDERDRGVSLVGPHRDDVDLSIGVLPAKGYASHGESWSLALALRLASFTVLRDDDEDDPVLILDDVFAELDEGRRDQLAQLVAPAEQVLVTAAVADDVPKSLLGTRFQVDGGSVTPDE
ncbi:DNA replication/repair protein RecF [Aeromicrobium sp. CTD01-1L150]|uniref:DNA replication/repair protein RecF n=1 Tax=Aeromicrobium sp. CTD01-1L150 TaxID=3341830 RepID=UPI0035C1E1C7